MTTTTGPTRPDLPTSDTYTSTRSGLAAAAAVVELLRDLPLVSVSVEPDGTPDPPIRIDVENVIAAGVAAFRLGIKELEPDPADRYREWMGFSWAVGEPIYVVLTHDQPARSYVADRRDRRHRIVTTVRAVLAFTLMIATCIPIGIATQEAYGWLPVALLWLALVLAPADYGIDCLIRGALDLLRRGIRRVAVRIRRGGAR